MVKLSEKPRRAMPAPKQEKMRSRQAISKFVGHKPKDKKQTREKNQFTFVGFYDRLKQLDVKQAHTMQMSQTLDSLMVGANQSALHTQVVDEQADMQSNFTAYLRYEKMNNRTLDFSKMYNELEKLCYNHALLVLNHKTIIEKLLKYLSGSVKPDDDSHSMQMANTKAQCIALDLFVCLVKDMRADIYEAFLTQILPAAIAVIDTQNIQLLDKIFSLLSFAVKYLVKNIKADIARFYSVFSMLIVHRNRHLRKFAAQGFSYVLRKFMTTPEELAPVVDILNEPLKTDRLFDMAQGISDLYFEMMYGAAEDLYSNSALLLQCLQTMASDDMGATTLRLVYIKLINSIDTSKQLPLFESLTKWLLDADETDNKEIILQIVLDALKLKQGRRVSHLATIQLLDSFNKLLKGMNSGKLAIQNGKLLSETLGLFYYLKHSELVQIYRQSNIDLPAGRDTNLFNNGFLKHSACHLESYLAPLFSKPNNLDLNIMGKDQSQIIGLRLNTSFEFNDESHRSKIMAVLPGLVKIMKTSNVAAVTRLLMQVQDEIDSGEELGLTSITVPKDVTLIEQHTYLKLATLIGKGTIDQVEGLMKNEVQVTASLQLEPNSVHERYGDVREKLIAAFNDLYDVRCMSGDIDEARIKAQMCTMMSYLKAKESSKIDSFIEHMLSMHKTDDMMALRYLQKLKPNALDNEQLFDRLSQNLTKNSSELRRLSIKLLCKFKKDEKVFELMDEFASSSADFTTERAKQMALERLEVMLKNDYVFEDATLTAMHRFFVGCLWVRFTPLFPFVHSAVSALINFAPQAAQLRLLQDHSRLLQGTMWLSQVELGKDLHKMVVGEPVNPQQLDLSTLIFAMDCNQMEESLLVKDFGFNMLKCLTDCIPSVMNSRALQTPFFNVIYEFVDNELNSSSKTIADSDDSIEDKLLRANQPETEEARAHRHQTFSTLAGILEVFKSCECSLKHAPRLECLQDVLLDQLSCTDNKVQKNALVCLIKTNYKQGLAQKYQRLLEGFADDEKFKDMVPYVVKEAQTDHRRSTAAAAEDDKQESGHVAERENDKLQQRMKRKETKQLIPNLEKQDRAAILPVIVRICQSKLQHKKGAINKKNVVVRRNIIYNLFSTFDPQTEFIIVLDELLRPLRLTYDEIGKEQYEQKLCAANCQDYLTLVQTFEIMLKQMGKFLTPYMPILMKFLLAGVLKSSKVFVNCLSDKTADELALHQSALRQGKESIKTIINLCSSTFKRFPELSSFSDQVYNYVVSDQLDRLNGFYVYDRSALISLLCEVWPEQDLASYESYERVVQKVFEMLAVPYINYEVVSLVFGLIKKLVGNTLLAKADLQKDKIGLKALGLKEKASQRLEALWAGQNDNSDGEQSENEQMKEVDDEEQKGLSVEEKGEISQKIIEKNITILAQALSAFWLNHGQELKQVLTSKGLRKHRDTKAAITNDAATKQKFKQMEREKLKKFQAAKDMLLVLSELSFFLEDEHEANAQFLNMIVEILSIRSLHTQSSNEHQEQILSFGSQTIANLIPKVSTGELTESHLMKVFQLFLHVNNAKVRKLLSHGLADAFEQPRHAALIRQDALRALAGMNGLKKSLADVELDCDQAITTIQLIQKEISSNKDSFKGLDLACILFSTIYLCSHAEFSMREYAAQLLTGLLQVIKEQDAKSLYGRLEFHFVKHLLPQVKDEMVLKTILKCTWALVDIGMPSQFHLDKLQPLGAAFFDDILGIQLKQRQSAIKSLMEYLAGNDQIQGFEHCIVPMLDYICLEGRSQLQNARHTVSYGKEQKRDLIDAALGVYEAYATRLRFVTYFKLVKKYLFKLQRCESKVGKLRSVQADASPELQYEKVLTKVMCSLMNGFSKQGLLPDAVHELTSGNKSVMHTLGSGFVQVDESSDSSSDQSEGDSDSDAEEQSDDDVAADEDEPMQGDKLSPQQIKSIQDKIVKQILPILARHLTDEGQRTRAASLEETRMTASESKHFRAFAVVCYAKAIRALDIPMFNRQLHKLINSIVVQGLRSRELSYREKARKTLVKLLGELSPAFLGAIFDEMRTQLVKGFQEHVYLYSAHWLLDSMSKNGTLDGHSWVTTRMIENNTPILLSELYGELHDQKNNEQHNERKVIKEARDRKAIPIFEVLAEHLDFNHSFPALISPIVRVLEESPSPAKIMQSQELLSRISSAVIKNKSVKTPELLAYLYTVIDRGVSLSTKIKINDEKVKRDYGATAEQLAADLGDQTEQGHVPSVLRRTRTSAMDETMKVEMHWRKGNETVGNKKTDEICGRVLAAFGLQCLKKALKGQIGDDDKDAVEKLDPFVPLLLGCFKTYHNPIVVTTLHVITQLTPFQLPSFTELCKKFLSRIFKLFQSQAISSSQGDTEFTNSLFKCTAELVLKSKKKNTALSASISDVQLKTLLEIIRDNLDKQATKNAALHLLKNVVKMKLVYASVYDTIEEQIQPMMLQSSVAKTRQLCQEVFVQFLLDYPLENTRIEQHLSFVVKNLQFPESSGRLSLLTTLEALVQKFPAEIISVYAELLFFALLLRCINESNEECRQRVTVILEKLVGNGKVTGDRLRAIFQSVLSLGKGDESQEENRRLVQLRLTKLYGLQVFAGTHAIKLKQVDIDKMLEAAQQNLKAPKEDLKLGKRQRPKGGHADEDSADEEVQRFLKAIDLDDEDEEETQAEHNDGEGEEAPQLVEQSLRLIEAMLVGQDAKVVIASISTLRLSEVIVKLAARGAHLDLRLLAHKILGHIFAHALDQKKKQPLDKLLSIESEQVNEWALDLTASLAKNVNEEIKEQIIKNLVFLLQNSDVDKSKLFMRLSAIGRRSMNDIRTATPHLAAILLFYSVSLDILKKQDELSSVCPHMLSLTIRITTDGQYTMSNENMKLRQDAEQIHQSLQQALGAMPYLECYQQVQKQIDVKRAERKQKAKQMIAYTTGVAGEQDEEGSRGLAEQAARAAQRKRARKAEKKKEKKMEKIFFSKLHR